MPDTTIKWIKVLTPIILGAFTTFSVVRAEGANAKTDGKVDNATLLRAVQNITNENAVIKVQIQQQNENIQKTNQNIEKMLQEMARQQEADANLRRDVERLKDWTERPPVPVSTP